MPRVFLLITLTHKNCSDCSFDALLAWHHARISYLFPTNDARVLRTVDMSGRQVAFAILFTASYFLFFSLRWCNNSAPEQTNWEPLCYVAKGQTTRSLISTSIPDNLFLIGALAPLKRLSSILILAAEICFYAVLARPDVEVMLGLKFSLSKLSQRCLMGWRCRPSGIHPACF